MTSKRTIQFGFEIQNITGRLVEGVEIGILVPVRESAAQRCCEDLASSFPGERILDSHGNQALRFRFERFPPHAFKMLRVRATLAIARAPVPAPWPDDGRWINPEPLIEADHPKIRGQARGLAHQDPFETARRIYVWVADNLAYAGYLRDARGALHALEQRRGDCTESMHLFVALARANGIPARGVAGYVLEQDGVVRAEAFHNWAEFYAGGAWRIADPQRKQFDAGYGQYIVTRILGVGGGAIPASANRFWIRGDGVQVKMQ